MMPLLLAAVSGLAWTLAYAEVLRTSRRDRWVAMPWFALALNLTWEGVHSVLGLVQAPTSVQTGANLLWLALDGAILVQFFRFQVRGRFGAFLVLVLALATVLQIAFVVQFGDRGSWFSAFLQNLVMSVAFFAALATGGTRKGQSLLFGVSKAVGTLAPTILFGVILGSPLVLVLGLGCLVFDLLYLAVWVTGGPWWYPLPQESAPK